MFDLHNPEREPIRCTLWTHPDGYELRLFVGASLLETRVKFDVGAIYDIVGGWKRGLETRGWSDSTTKPKPVPAKWLHTEDGEVCGYLADDGESLFDSSGEKIGRLEGTLMYTPEGAFFGYTDDERKWIYDQMGHQLAYLA